MLKTHIWLYLFSATRYGSLVKVIIKLKVGLIICAKMTLKRSN